VTSVGFIGGYAIAARANSRRIYFHARSLCLDGLDYIATEQSTGDIVGFSIVSDQVWTFCEQVNGDFRHDWRRRRSLATRGRQVARQGLHGPRHDRQA